MSEFEFLFSVFGLLIGLTFIEIAIKFADAIDAHRVGRSACSRRFWRCS